jgi:hypothetical protein
MNAQITFWDHGKQSPRIGSVTRLGAVSVLGHNGTCAAKLIIDVSAVHKGK